MGEFQRNRPVKMQLGLAQIDTKLGLVEANLQKHLDFIDKACQAGVDLLLFPELSLTGYILQDLVPAVAHSPNASDAVFKELFKASQKIDLLVGFVEEDERNRFYIANAYLSQGELVHLHRKVYLPTYGLFDEGRFFAWGDRNEAFNTRFGRCGCLICEDFWHVSPPYLLWLDGADLFLFTSASPGRGLTEEPQLATSLWVESINRAYASIFTAFVAHCNRVGFEDGLHFWGGSTVYDPDGKCLAKAPYDKEAFLTVELDLNQLHRTRARLPLLRDERPAMVQREMDRIIANGQSSRGK